MMGLRSMTAALEEVEMTFICKRCKKRVVQYTDLPRGWFAKKEMSGATTYFCPDCGPQMMQWRDIDPKRVDDLLERTVKK